MGASALHWNFMTGPRVLHYQLLEKLGEGGMGEVYKAQDTRLNRWVAIKSLTGVNSGNPGRRRRFLQEAQAASALNHPNIITIYDVVSAGDAEYMVIEYIEGKTLTDVIPKGGLGVPQALQYAVQIADALRAAHGAGIVHRDLKPGNVMVTNSGLVKILDFGLAKIIAPGPIGQADETVTITGDAILTVEGSILGTVHYMSPEQAQGQSVDARSDIFSFGSLLYEMVSGRRAFDGQSTIGTLTAVLRDESKPISQVSPGVPAALEQLIFRCHRKDPAERWQSMREVHAELINLKRQADSGATRISMKALAAGAVALAIIGAGAGGWWRMSHRGEAPQAAISTVHPSSHGDVPLTNDMVLEMVQAKVPVALILTHIRASKPGFDLSTAEVIRLTKAGVPESVIEAMHDPKGVSPATRF